MRRPAAANGFTLVELLVTITIVIVVASFSIVGVECAQRKARSVTEISAARNLIAGYLGYAADHNGTLLPGYQKDPTATNLEGKLMSSPPNARYPWRLAPSVPAIKGVLLYNGNESILEDPQRDYKVSLRPNMGINATFVGGSYGGDGLNADSPRVTELLGKYYVSSLSEANEPEKLVTFASARSTEKGMNVQGHHRVDAPNVTARQWSSKKFAEDGSPADHGYVDFRWNGKAVAAMLGGNVELLTEDELRDMRRWSNLASKANDKDHILSGSR